MLLEALPLPLDVLPDFAQPVAVGPVELAPEDVRDPELVPHADPSTRIRIPASDVFICRMLIPTWLQVRPLVR